MYNVEILWFFEKSDCEPKLVAPALDREKLASKETQKAFPHYKQVIKSVLIYLGEIIMGTNIGNILKNLIIS